MSPSLASKLGGLSKFCIRNRVRRLSLFGSAAREGFDPAGGSDVDFLVEFLPMPPRDRAESYFGLLADFEKALGLPVDLVEEDAIKNPYFRDEVSRSRRVLFEAA